MKYTTISDPNFIQNTFPGAIEYAASKLKLYKKISKKKPDAKTPYIRKDHLILNNQSCKLNDTLRIPIKLRI